MGRLGNNRLGTGRLGRRVFGRDLTQAVIDELTKTHVDVELFLEIQFDAGTKRYWSGIGDETLSGNTFKGTGRYLGLDAVRERTGLRTDKVDFDLTGIDSDLKDRLLNNDVQDRTVKLWIVFYDDSGNQINDEVLLFQGHIDDMRLSVDPESPTIKLTAETGAIDWTRPKRRLYDPQDQKEEYSSDKGFDFVPALPHTAISWGQETIRIDKEPGVRNIVYGRARVSKPPVFVGSTSSGKYLHVVQPFAAHEIDRFEKIYLDESVAWTNSGGVQSPYTNNLRVNTHLGKPGQSADSDLQSEVTNWTSDHRLREVAYVYLRFKYSDEVYPQGLPEISVIGDGKIVRDPRNSTDIQSDNVSLCMRDYILDSRLGMNRPTSDLDGDNFIEAADISDWQIDTVGGNTIEKYTVNRSFDTDRSPRDILIEMKDLMAGFLTYSGGKFVPIAGTHYNPEVEYTETDLDQGYEISAKRSRSERFNSVRGKFSFKDDDYNQVSYPTVKDSAAITADNNKELWKTIDQPGENHPSRAQRTANIMLQRNRNQKEVPMEFQTRELLRNRAGDVVEFTHDFVSWSKKQFRIRELVYNFDDRGGGIKIVPKVVFREYDSAIYDWDPSTDEKSMSAATSPTTPDRKDTQVQRYDSTSDFDSAGKNGRLLAASNDGEIHADDGSNLKKVGDVTSQNVEPVDISEEGTTVVADVEDIDCTAGIDVIDNGDDTVKIYVDSLAESVVGGETTFIKTSGDDLKFSVDNNNDLVIENDTDSKVILTIDQDTGAIDGVEISSHGSRHEKGGGDEVLPENMNGAGGTADQFLKTDGSATSWDKVSEIKSGGKLLGTLNDKNDKQLIDSVAASGQVTLSSGEGTVGTGISATDATFVLALGIDDPNADAQIFGRLFWDDSAGEYKVKIVEHTSIGNPTVNYDVIRVR